MTALSSTVNRQQAAVGRGAVCAEPAPPVELARYRTPADGERVLQGTRVHGRAIVVDVPADPGGGGRVYLVERDVHLDGNSALVALLDDYVRQAERHGQIPMRIRCSYPYLEELP